MSLEKPRMPVALKMLFLCSYITLLELGTWASEFDGTNSECIPAPTP